MNNIKLKKVYLLYALVIYVELLIANLILMNTSLNNYIFFVHQYFLLWLVMYEKMDDFDAIVYFFITSLVTGLAAVSNNFIIGLYAFLLVMVVKDKAFQDLDLLEKLNFVFIFYVMIVIVNFFIALIFSDINISLYNTIIVNTIFLITFNSIICFLILLKMEVNKKTKKSKRHGWITDD